MCNITFVDCDYNVITARNIRDLTTINSLLGNIDGFGYYLFNNDKLIKTREESAIYWRSNYLAFEKKNDIYNGIYHVRKASTNIIPKDGSQSHPFSYNDIVVAHNGFLNFRLSHVDADKYEKDIRGDIIDSQKFAIVLSKICETGKVTFENIKSALNLFSGAYALIIKGKQDNTAWLVRGKDRTLYQMTILYKKEKRGVLVNTTPLGLIFLGERLLEIPYFDYEFKELKDNTAYRCELGKFDLIESGAIYQDSMFKSATTIVGSNYRSGYSPYGRDDDDFDNYTWKDDTIHTEVIDNMYALGFTFTDLVILSETLHNKPVWLLNDGEVEELNMLLKKLADEHHKGRAQLWRELCDTGTPTAKLYTDYALSYPHILNTKNELQHALLKIKEKGKAHELATL